MTNGIYTLANDVVYDQLVSLLNSMEVNGAKELPVCVIPYDNRLDKVRSEIASRSNVTLFDNLASIEFWEDFATQAWTAHEKAQKAWKLKGWKQVHCMGMHRKFCSFDGPFEKFVYFDADTLLMSSLDYIYEKLEEYDWVANDFQYRSDPNYVFDFSSNKLAHIFDIEKLKQGIFCAGWFASKKGVLNRGNLADLLNKLKAGEAEVMSLRGTDQPLFNYLVARSGVSFYNFAYHGIETATGSHWSSKFDEIEHVLYDNGKPITYLHYMSVSSSKFTKLCEGEDTGIPYKDLFLHYRYLNSPNERPTLKHPSWLEQKKRAVSKFLNQKIDNLNYKLRQLQSRE
ncbi:MAG: Npun_R2821/Npun_R2822 family protein [Limnoraphis robusta]|uniref:Sugar transferase n=1 Tax=Limnoraphis robusta CS-951 TaxID=1637645 RepID=A0A0F5YDD2_9CYAN|nr:Npun_R2821/Npun_R2822 family protein [Limnoraphis robusta]KKD36919.1 sugar transferase [Limnoraphis robusta CS-951]KMW70613.1 sugar transferase [Limnoraphis robusta CS-951]